MDHHSARMVLAGSIGVAVALALVACSPAAPAPATAGSTPVPRPSASARPTPAPTPTPTPVKTPAPVVTPIAGAPDSGVVVHVVAKNVRWEAATLSAPAGKTWQAEVANQDGVGSGVPHNFAVASGPDDVALRIFVSPRIEGGETKIFEIPALPAGTYLFICTPHYNTMTGTLIVE